jgi:uncharacterized protein (TIGR03000 family)
MKSKLLVLALASCAEFFFVSGSAQAQLIEWKRYPVDVNSPGYQPAVLGKKGAGVYDGYGRRYYGLPDYGAAMAMYGFPIQVYPSYLPANELAHGYAGPAGSSTVTGGYAHEMGAPAGGTTTSQSFYAGAGSASDKTEFHVKVPVPNAKVYFNDKLVEQDGTDRKLITPPVQPGTYTYRVRATWTENGETQTQEQKLRAEPGQVMNVAFGKQ